MLKTTYLRLVLYYQYYSFVFKYIYNVPLTVAFVAFSDKSIISLPRPLRHD